MFLMLFVLFHWLTIDTPSDTKCLCKWTCLCPCFTHFLSWMNLRKCCIESRVEKTHWLKCAFKVAIKVCVCVCVSRWVCMYVCVCCTGHSCERALPCFPAPPLKSISTATHTYKLRRSAHLEKEQRWLPTDILQDTIKIKHHSRKWERERKKERNVDKKETEI